MKYEDIEAAATKQRAIKELENILGAASEAHFKPDISTGLTSLEVVIYGTRIRLGPESAAVVRTEAIAEIRRQIMRKVDELAALGVTPPNPLPRDWTGAQSSVTAIQREMKERATTWHAPPIGDEVVGLRHG